MAYIVTEKNSKRKAHRLTIPLLVELDGRVYETKDWSVDGIGIVDCHLELEKEQLVAARVIFPITDSTLSISVTLECKNIRNGNAGFAFHELEHKHKRLLRHYIEQVIEGKLENVEDLVAIATAPTVSSPINNALNLSDIQTEALQRQFSRRSKLMIFFAVILFALIGLSLFYKVNYQVKSTGVVLGNTFIIKANKSGMLDAIYAKEGQKVEQGDAIVTIVDPDITSEIETVKAKINVLEQGKRELAMAQSEDLSTEDSLLAPLKLQEQKNRENVEKSKKLLVDNVITQKDFDYIEGKWLDSLVNLRKEQQRIERLRLQGQQALLRNNVLSGQRIEEQLLMYKQELQVLESKQYSLIKSAVSGNVFNVSQNMGTVVTRDEVVAIIETNDTPFIVLNVANDKMLKLKVGQVARVYVPKFDTEFQAKIVAFGRQSIAKSLADFYPKNPNSGIVKLQFSEAVQLPPFTRTEVWVDTFELL